MRLTYKTCWGTKIAFEYDADNERIVFDDGRTTKAKNSDGYLYLFYEDLGGFPLPLARLEDLA